MTEIDACLRRYEETRAELIHSAVPGVAAARRLSDLTDEAVRDLARAASSRITGRWALVALGGWGAGALLPASDLDLLVLAQQPEPSLKPFVEALLYPLWDAGLKVGHQVRSPRHQRRAMRDDLKTCTAALTARVLAGDTAWADFAVRAWVSDVARRPRRVLDRFAERPRTGSPYLLEPDLKDGPGGRRDYDELTWRAAVLSGAPSADCTPLVSKGVMTPDEAQRALAHAATICTARWELQRGGQGERMTADAAAELRACAADDVQRALGETALLLERVRQRASQARPTGAAEVLGDTDGLDAASVFELLGGGPEGLHALELAAQSGHLHTLMPGARTLMTVRRPGLGHELTVGAHCLKAASAIASLRDDGPLGRSFEAMGDMRVAQVAALVHDAGKADCGPGHAERGAPIAHDAAIRFGLDSAAACDVAELVRLHLVLVETAFRDDLDDEDTVLRCADRVGHRTLLAPLHVLTAVDSIATGRSTWTPWKAALVGSLVSRLDAALSDAFDGAGLAARGETTRTAALGAMTAASDAERAFVAAASVRYLAARSPERVARDAGLVASISGSAGVDARIAVSAGPAERTHTVTVAVVDRSHALARLAGAMALAGLDILSVDAFAAPSGVALDEFVVSSATERVVTEDTFAALERFVLAALRDRLGLATRLAERRRHYPPRADIPTSVTAERSGWNTVVEVTSADRPGLLHDIASALSACGVDIRWARIQTIDGVARDTFHVTGADGGAIDDPGVLGHLAMRIRAIR